MSIIWGLLSSETVNSSRRVRHLGLSAAVRDYNARAVPGLGSVFFGKELLWSLLGISCAARARNEGIKCRNTEVANALEAMAALCAINDTPEQIQENRSKLRGRIKLNGKTFCTFAQAKRKSFYVSQPFRMSTGDALRGLSLTSDAARFDSLECTSSGDFFLKTCLGGAANHIFGAIRDWLTSDKILNTIPTLKNSLNAYVPLPPEACNFLLNQLKSDPRRKNALQWIATEQKTDWDHKPDCIEEAHWHDLYTGSRFFACREAAIAVLEALEWQVGSQANRTLPLNQVHLDQNLLNSLTNAAKDFLNCNPDNTDACEFSNECMSSSVVENLIRRDGRILRLCNGTVIPGSAFRFQNQATPEDNEEDNEGFAPEDADMFSQLPNISSQIYNLYALYNDLRIKD